MNLMGYIILLELVKKLNLHKLKLFLILCLIIRLTLCFYVKLLKKITYNVKVF